MSTQDNDQASFAERVRRNQHVLRAALKPRCDFIVRGAGSSGSVVARRVSEDGNPALVLGKDILDRKFDIKILDPGVAAFSFAFGWLGYRSGYGRR